MMRNIFGRMEVNAESQESFHDLKKLKSPSEIKNE